MTIADLNLKETARGLAWVEPVCRREQPGWTEPAALIDRLVEAGVIVLGGPVGALDADRAFLIVKARDEDEVRTRLESDPSADGVRSISRVRSWTIWPSGYVAPPLSGATQ